MRKPPWSIPRRKLVATIVPLLLLATLMSFVFAHQRLADLDAAQLVRAQALARQLAVAGEFPALAADLRQILQRIAAAALDEEDVIGVRFIAADGRFLAGDGANETSPPWPQDGLPIQTWSLLTASSLYIVEPIRALHLELADGFKRSGENAGAEGADQGAVMLELARAGARPVHEEALQHALGVNGAILLLSLLLMLILSRDTDTPTQPIGNAAPASGRRSRRRRLQRTRAAVPRFERRREAEAKDTTSASTRQLAMASHDLRQPAHALGLFAAELSLQPLDPHSRQLVKRIAAASSALNGLLDSLLDLSRLDCGTLQALPSAFALQPLLERIAASHAGAAERGLHLRLRRCQYWVRSDPALLERILCNLLGNAMAHTQAGTVLLACRRRGSRLRIEIRDSGPGIELTAQTRIFEDFVRLGPSAVAGTQGLGLGLPIVRRLSKLLDHRLSLRSAPGRGTVFAVEIPLATPEPDAAETMDAPSPGDRLHGLAVTVIDANVEGREALSGLLRSWGCRVSAAACPRTLALQLRHSPGQPDVLIADLNAGGANDASWVERMRSQLLDTKLILLTADTRPAALAHASACGVPLLHKPVKPARLRALMQRLVCAQQTNEEASSVAHSISASVTMTESSSTCREYVDVRKQERSRPAGIRTRNVEQHGFLAPGNGDADARCG